MKRQLWLALLGVLLLSFWVGRDLLKPEFFRSHDALFHVLRLNEFHQSFSSGQFPVRWAPTLLKGLGYPLFVINYHLPYYLAESFLLVGFSSFTAIKLIFFLSLVGSALSAFWLFIRLTKKPLAAFTGAAFFTLAPYRLANVFERGALGEAVAYAFVPLVFLGLEELKAKKSITLWTIALTGLILSHTVVAIEFLPVIILYAAIFVPWSWETFKRLSFGVALALGMSAFQMVPAFLERRFMQFDASLLTSYQGHFKSIYQLLRIPHGGVNIGTRFQVGLAHLATLLVAAGMAIRTTRRQLRLLLFFFITISIGALVLVVPLARPAWDGVPFLRFVLYPWRFLGVTAFAIAALAALVVTSTKFSKILGVLIFALLLFTTRHYTRVDEFIKPELAASLLESNGTTENEFDPVGLSKEALTAALPEVEVIQGATTITNFSRKPNKWQFTSEGLKGAQIKLGLLYFPGWEARVDGQPTPIDTDVVIEEKDLRGLVVVAVPPGTHSVQVQFGETPVRQAGNVLSLMSLVLFTGVVIAKSKKS